MTASAPAEEPGGARGPEPPGSAGGGLGSAKARARDRPVPKGRRASRMRGLRPRSLARVALDRLGTMPTEEQLLDYARACVELTAQRQVIYLATLILAIGYYDPLFGVAFYVPNVVLDLLELRWAVRVRAEGPLPPARLRRHFATVLAFTAASTLAISLFVAGAARFEGPAGHFTPLVFLLAAALFATMNTHQVILALAIRLVGYGAAFLYIPGRDVLATGAPLSSLPWLHLFTSIFVLFFILDCARMFLQLHRENVRRLAELRVAEARARRALAVQTEFISIVSHELRSPLTSVNGALALAASGRLGTPPERIGDLLQVAARNGRRLAALVNDILDVQKLAAGQMSFERVPVDLDDLVAECVEANRHLSEDVRLVALPRGATPAVAIADRHRLLQVLTNVVSNAVKFSPRGGTVEIGTTRGPDRVGIEVRDRGRGIPPGSEAVVFGQFTQVDSSDRREKQGSGLGMSIAQRIMEAMGGTIGYDSEVGVGTTFHLDFPEPAAGAAGADPREGLG